MESSVHSAPPAAVRVTGRAETRDAAATDGVRLFVYVASGAYALIFGAVSVLHYARFGYARFDLGNMTQAVWSTAHGRLLETTGMHGEQFVRLGVHTDWFLVLLAPLWWLWPSPVAMLVLQALLVSAGALPVYWLARKYVGGGKAPAHFALAYLLYPATQFNTFTPGAGFHAVSLALPLILFAIWFLDEGRFVAFAATAGLAMSTKEEIGAAVGCLGVWYAVRRGRRAAGATIFFVGVAVTLVNFLVVIPHFSGGLDPFADRYANVGGSPGGILRTAATHPWTLVATVATVHKAVYLVLLFAPLLGLWAFEPLLLLGAAPDLVINLLSSKSEQTTLAYQYTAGIVPFLFAAAVIGSKRLRRDPAWTSLYALAAVGCVALYTPLWALAIGGDAAPPSATQSARAHAVAIPPPSARVSASNNLGARLSERRYIYLFPYVGNAQWVVVDRNDPKVSTLRAQRSRSKVDALERNPAWTTVYTSHGVVVLRRS